MFIAYSNDIGVKAHKYQAMFEETSAYIRFSFPFDVFFEVKLFCPILSIIITYHDTIFRVQTQNYSMS